jgi:predicted dehydrogenase
MVNTTLDLIGEEIAEVTALADNRGTPVEIAAVVSARSRSGILISLTAAGDSVQCVSEVLVCGDGGILQTGIWGERLNIKRAAQPAFEAVPVPKSRGVWEQFLRVRAGRMPNPCPPEIGLRFARFMDMVRRSAAAGRAVRASP